MRQKKISKRIFICLSCIMLSLLCCKVERTTQEEAQQVLSQVKPKEVLFDDPEGKLSQKDNYYFIFDGSGSMEENCAGQKKITGAKEAFRRVITKVPADVNLGLYVFDGHGAREVVPMGSNNRDAILEAVDNVRANSNTPLGEAITFAADQLVKQYKKQLGYGRYKIIPITDGEANGNTSIESAAKYVARYGFITVHTIGLCMDQDHSLRVYSYSYRAANDFQALEKALEEAVAEADVFEPTKFVEK